MTTTTWNSADKDNWITLTNGDLTAEQTDSEEGAGGVRGTTSKTTGAGKLCVQMTVNQYAFVAEYGLAKSSHLLTDTLSETWSGIEDAIGIKSGLSEDDVVKIYFDFATGAVAIDVNDVETITFSGVDAGPWYPYARLFSTEQAIINASPTGLRSGYLRWDYEPAIEDVTESPSAQDVLSSGMDISDTITESTALLGAFAEELYWIEDYSEAYDLADAYSVLATALLTEAISLSGVLSSTMITTTDVSQSITLGELYTVTAIQAVSEGMEMDGSFSSTLRLIAAATEALEGADAYTGSLNVSAAVTVTAALAMALDDQFAANIAEGMTFNDTYAVALKYIAAITAAMQLADTYTNTMTVAMLVTESMELEGAIASNITIVEALQEGLSLSMAFSLGDTDYVAWVINANTGAASRYTNFPFNSFATVAGRHLACSEDGLYEITGDDDDGTDIDASILTGLMDFGSNVFKRVISCQIGYNGDGELLLKAVVVQGGEPKEYWYQPRSQTAAGVRESVAKLGKGLKSHFWQFELINVDGADFEIDSIRWYPVALERRR